MRPCIPPGSVAKARNMPDIAALSHLVRRTPEHLNLVNLFLREPLAVPENDGENPNVGGLPLMINGG